MMFTGLICLAFALMLIITGVKCDGMTRDGFILLGIIFTVAGCFCFGFYLGWF